jgi:hypothetical protein
VPTSPDSVFTQSPFCNSIFGLSVAPGWPKLFLQTVKASRDRFCRSQGNRARRSLREPCSCWRTGYFTAAYVVARTDLGASNTSILCVRNPLTNRFSYLNPTWSFKKSCGFEFVQGRDVSRTARARWRAGQDASRLKKIAIGTR